MIRISNLETITDSNNIRETIPKLMQKIQPVLEKRKQLHAKYSRKADDKTLMYTVSQKEDGELNKKSNVVVSYEKFLTDIAAGYLSGTPVYSVTCSQEDDKKKLLKELFDREVGDEEYKTAMELVIDYVTGFNDDTTEHHELVHDLLELTSCYEILYENKDNEIVYSKYSPLSTVALWDYSIPANLIALVRVWDESDINDRIIHKCEITDKNGTKTYSITENYKEVTETDNQNHNWGDVPAIAVETDYAIFEPCEDIIQCFETLIKNIRNTFQYNDTDCKLKFSGYMPENPITTEVEVKDEEGNPVLNEDGTTKTKTIVNEARKKEDEYIQKALNLYVAEGGDVDWITKPLDSNGAVETLKVYTNLMFQLAGIPNTSDLAFNSTDLNASAIDRKFYIMNMMTASVISKLKKAYQRRWKLIFERINLKKNTKFDARDIDIDLPKNLPANNDEVIDSMLKLQNILSEQTIIEKIGYNYLDEKNKKDSEAEDNMLANIKRMKMLEAGGADIGETTLQEQTGKDEINTMKSSDQIINDVQNNTEAEQEKKIDDKENSTNKEKKDKEDK
ncbi:MAG TPA: phage portal protein [Candidatus Coprosoma intestinipullorum]|uniref:Phage portal protein n=1 Tax=Candidatus Coprosoma intestinipullorum TaxID=2840752 RepID=A0A9D0ZRM7_9FIRM|nr:phage portal protein [Candidatus Coprosoma intestinipullorum]